MLNLVTDLYQGHVNSHLFTPDQFLQQLVKVNSNLPAGSRVPETPQDDLKPLYKLLKGKARVTSRRIIFDITLPLVSTSEYQLYKVIPVPTKHGNHRVSIVPESKFLMITLEKDYFYQLSENEYTLCQKTTNLKAICKIHHPSYSAQSNRSKCERQLLVQNTRLSEFCQFKITSEEDVWIQLQKRNEWIYAVNEELTLNVVCDRAAFPVKIQGTNRSDKARM